MIILTFREAIQLEIAGCHVMVNPGERLIFESEHTAKITANPDAHVFEVTDLMPYIEGRKPPDNWQNRRLLFYRRGAVGDALVASCLPRYFREVLGAQAYVATERAHVPIWLNHPYVTGLPVLMPIHLDAVWRYKGRPFFDYAWFLERVSEYDSDSEQANVYDRLFSICGIDPETVPDDYKRPVFALAPEELEASDSVLQQLGAAFGRDLAKGCLVIQPLSADITRSFPDALIHTVLQVAQDVAAEHDWTILVVHSEKFRPEIHEAIEKTERAIDTSGMIGNIRTFAAIIESAKGVVGPDSSGVHFAAAFSVPSVALFATHTAASRTQYYPRNVTLNPELCPPCHNVLTGVLPLHRCPRGEAQTHCENFRISADEVASALREVLK